jgi:hypothetical protein
MSRCVPCQFSFGPQEPHRWGGSRNNATACPGTFGYDSRGKREIEISWFDDEGFYDSVQVMVPDDLIASIIERSGMVDKLSLSYP